MAQIKKIIFSFVILISCFNAIAIEIIGISDHEYRQLNINETLSFDEFVSELQQKLYSQGFITTDVWVEEDKIYVYRGKLTQIETTGFDSTDESFIKSFFEPLINQPLNLQTLERPLSLVNDLSGINASLTIEKNEQDNSLLTVQGRQKKQSGFLSYDSLPRDEFDRHRVYLQQEFYSTFTTGDLIRLKVTRVDGDGKDPQNDFGFNYRLPLNKNGLYAEVSASDLRSKTNMYTFTNGVTRRDFDGKNYALTLGYPLIRNHNHYRYVILSPQRTEEKTQSISQDNQINLVRGMIYDHIAFNDGDSLSWGLTFTQGHANHSNSNQNGSFKHYRAGVGYIKALNFFPNDTEVRFEAFGQYTKDSLPGSESFFLGSENFLRGYRYSTYNGNRGAMATLEVAQNYETSHLGFKNISPYAFYDTGYVDNELKDTISDYHPKDATLNSLGFGARFHLQKNINGQLYWAQPLDHDAKGRDLGSTLYLQLGIGW